MYESIFSVEIKEVIDEAVTEIEIGYELQKS